MLKPGAQMSASSSQMRENSQQFSTFLQDVCGIHEIALNVCLMVNVVFRYLNVFPIGSMIPHFQ